MKEYSFTTDEITYYSDILRAGDKVLLSGTVFTARDAAHKRIFELLDSGKPLPFPIESCIIYYAGPTPTPPHLKIGSCGPTTSGRMDKYTPRLIELGISGMIGKGPRSDEVIKSLTKHKAVYFCAVGGAGALASKSITDCEVIAFDDLGCESVKRLTVANFPLICGIDAYGGNIFEKN